MKKIIVPVDFSEQSEFALEAAAALAKKLNSEIMALHMLELSPVMISSSEGYHPEQTFFLIKHAEKRFESFLKQDYLKGIKVTPIIKHYKVFKEVNEVAKETESDLIVMGSHGVDGLKEMFVGSNTERVVRNSEIPVLVIKGKIENFKIEQIVLATDFREESIAVFNKASEFADKLSATLWPVYINVPGDDFRSTKEIYSRISKFLNKAHKGKEVEIYNDYSVERGILNYSENANADLIAIPTHGRRGISHFFMGSIGEDIANHSKIPVLTLKI